MADSQVPFRLIRELQLCNSWGSSCVCVRCLWFTYGSFPGVLTSFTVTDEDLSFFFGEVLPHLNERRRRIVGGAAARALGHGGVRAVAGASGLSLSTVQNGARAVDAGIEPSDRVRAPGAGRTPSRTRRRTATPCTGSSTQVVRAAGEEAGDFSGAGGASGGVLGRLGQRR